MIIGIQAMKQELDEILKQVVDQASAKCQINASPEEGKMSLKESLFFHERTR